jgi:hypothetical protein
VEPGEPTLDDGVITLRAPDEGDLEAIETGLHDPEVVHFPGSPPGTASEVLELNPTCARDGSPTFAIGPPSACDTPRR